MTLYNISVWKLPPQSISWNCMGVKLNIVFWYVGNKQILNFVWNSSSNYPFMYICEYWDFHDLKIFYIKSGCKMQMNATVITSILKISCRMLSCAC